MKNLNSQKIYWNVNKILEDEQVQMQLGNFVSVYCNNTNLQNSLNSVVILIIKILLETYISLRVYITLKDGFCVVLIYTF